MSEKENKFALTGLKSYRLDEICAHDVACAKYEKSKWMNRIIRLIAWIFFDMKNLEYLNKNGEAIAFSQSAIMDGRNDRENSYKLIQKCVNVGVDVLSYNSPTKYRLSLLKSCYIIPMMFIWSVELLINGIRGINFFIYLRACIIIKKMLWELKKIDFSKYKFLLLYFDISIYDSIICEYFKTIGITTVTAAHAMFTRKENVKGISYEGLELTHSQADYFMAWNNFMRDEAISCGMRPEKIKVLGIPKFIDYKTSEYNREEKNRIFGVVLSAMLNENETENRTLIADANQIAETLNYKYILRYHPGANCNEYDEIVDEKYYIGSSSNEIDIEKYAKEVDFTLVGSSSVFIELIFMGKPVYHRIITLPDRFGKSNAGCYKNINELIEIMKSEPERIYKDMFNYYCTVEEPGKKYREFFDELVNVHKADFC